MRAGEQSHPLHLNAACYRWSLSLYRRSLLADNRLDFRDFPPGDFGGSSNIDGANDVGMIEMTTFATQK
jgi:hypothetical protein